MEDGPGSVMMGSWTPAEDPAVTEERMAVFEQGIAALTGVSYIPVAYLGSQVVAGRNHAFLCKSVTAYPGSLEAEPAYVIVYLYQDLRGNVSVLSISDFHLGSLCRLPFTVKKHQIRVFHNKPQTKPDQWSGRFFLFFSNVTRDVTENIGIFNE